MLAPTARGTGTPSTSVRKGMISTPPPNPNSAPTNPATMEPRKMIRTSTGPSATVGGTLNLPLREFYEEDSQAQESLKLSLKDMTSVPMVGKGSPSDPFGESRAECQSLFRDAASSLPSCD